MVRTKKKQIYLIKYDSEGTEHKFYISNFGYSKFIQLYKEMGCFIKIIHFYGSDLKKDYETKEAEGIINLESLDNLIVGKEDLILNKLEFSIQGKMEMDVSFNDDFECSITSKSENFWTVQLKPLIEYFGFDESIKQKLLEQRGNYVAIGDNNIIEAVFESFDEFLKSDFTTDPSTFERY